MLKYIIKRLIFGLATIFIVSTLTFFLMQQVPGGPFAADKSISKAAQKALEVKYGLDKPITVQYINYFKNVLHGDFGISIKQRGRDVAQIISSKFPVSARVGGISIIIEVRYLTGSSLYLPPWALRYRALLSVQFLCIYSALSLNFCRHTV